MVFLYKEMTVIIYIYIYIYIFKFACVVMGINQY